MEMLIIEIIRKRAEITKVTLKIAFSKPLLVKEFAELPKVLESPVPLD